MSTILLPILPGEMPQGFCFTSWQDLLVVLSNAQKAVLDGTTFFNYGDTLPAPEFQAFPWLNTSDMRWYRYDGKWLSNNPETSQQVLRIFEGEAADVNTYDGGDNNPPSDRSGPMWVIAAEYVGRVPIGVGTVPGTTAPVVTTNVGDDIGEGQHSITAAEGATADHIHAMGLTNQDGSSTGDDVFLRKLGGPNTVPGYTGFYVTGNSTKVEQGQTQADLYTLPSGIAGAGVTPTPLSLIQPSRAVYFIRRTSRIFYAI